MVHCASNAVYSDDLFTATDLNRQSGQVLDRAFEHPVTITRNEQSFALLRREEMANLVKGKFQLELALQITLTINQLNSGEKVGSEHPYGWLAVFDAEELNELNVEIRSAVRHCSDAGNWDLLDAVIHEWRESAIAIESSELAAAFNDEINQVPLTQPTVA